MELLDVPEVVDTREDMSDALVALRARRMELLDVPEVVDTREDMSDAARMGVEMIEPKAETMIDGRERRSSQR
jgi:hypothetical protein